MTMTDSEQLLREVADKQAIERMLSRYCRAVDRCDVELLKSVFHPDGTSQDLGPALNAHEWAEAVIPALKAMFDSTMHHIAQLDIELDGDRATSESYYTAYHQVSGERGDLTAFLGSARAETLRADAEPGQGFEYVGAGRYLHRWERRNGEWRMTERVTTFEFNTVRLRSIGAAGSVMGDMPEIHRRDRRDPVYAYMR
jgi:hypothetical protein